MSQKTKLNLAVICTQEAASFGGYKGTTDLASTRGANGDVLEVGVTGGQTPCSRHRLIETGVDTTLRIALRGKGVYVGALELGKGAILQDQGWQPVLSRQGLQDSLVGGRAALGGLDHGQFKVFKEDFTQLKRAVEVERLSNQSMCLGFQRLKLNLVFFAELVEEGGVNLDSEVFHLCQDTTQRHLQSVQKVAGLSLLKLVFEFLVQQERHVRIFGGIGGGLLKLYHVKAAFGATFSCDLSEGRCLGLENIQRQRIQGVAGASGIDEITGQHGVKEDFAWGDSMFEQDLHFILGVVSHHFGLLDL